MTREEKIGLNFRYARLQAGVQIKKFAESVDDTAVIISNFERGVWVPSFRKFVKWCIALNASLDRIVYGDDYRKLLNLQNTAERLKADEEYHNNFCNLLRCKREEKQLSRSEAAALCNISRQYMREIENGALPSVVTLYHLCKIYDLLTENLENEE